MSTSERMRNYRGPVLFSYGFRPFFLLSALWAALAMAIWVAMLGGAEILPLAFDPFSWHAHEFLYGYLAGVIAGFLLTAVPNWTGRLPVMGAPLAGLVGLWLLGRVAVAVSGLIDWRLVMLADLALGLALLAFLAREVLRGRNWRNLPVLALLGLFTAGNALFHIEAARGGAAFEGLGMRLGLAAALILIALIGGRIIPSFTRNWLAARGAGRLPAAFGRGDGAVLGLTALTLAGFVAAPDASAMPWLMLACGAAHLWRLARWQGVQTGAEPLLWVLHLAYALLALGFWAEAAAGFGLLAAAPARHVWLAGTIGLMTLAVMSRASLGHSGRALHAGRGTTALYLALLGSVALRLLAGLLPAQVWLLHLSGTLWLLAFGGFALLYLPVLAGPKIARKPVSGPGRTA
ncbi:NnrS family protein [Paracoccus sp. PS-1]|uniref:NnrS family protein n=1 Tax=unclassified Paracoccus (in: a-proteobacteria) TaxID=2688777 RepID=UPI00048D8C39|nr:MULTISPECIES: NnrS family protein [unclassified Paracoccus (in: a-proteobacteria)]MDQ7262922.1 NnrS family protein [Paracoccus sp. PS1]